MENVMLDLETLSTEPNAMILSIGLVEFDSKGLGENLGFALDLEEQEKLGRHISYQTASWWTQRDAKAREIFTKSIIKTKVSIALESVTKFVTGKKVWGNGSDFDNVILASLYRDMGLQVPWTYKNSRCYRTLRALIPPFGEKFVVAHNALDDALQQAKHASQILARFEIAASSNNL